ncbi:serine hydrolase [Paenibacillus tengchongensis]|uniref:serine hydrolase n=1 Tax=Paenibacillus tengchongensis TaxID=2608684 RepID=UPI00124F643D|nr:serine hydrolase [Paenibacillus tengchongensis]
MSIQAEIGQLLSSIKADFGIKITEGRGQAVERFAINEDRRFHMASVIKMLILIEVLLQADEGNISLEEQIDLERQDHVSAPGTYFGMRHLGAPATVLELLSFMIALNDSLIADYFITRLSKDALNRRFAGLGLKNTQIDLSILELNMRSYGIAPSIHIDSWQDFYSFSLNNQEYFARPEVLLRAECFNFAEHNYSTAGDLESLIRRFITGKLASPELTALGIHILKGQTSKNRMPFRLPPEAEAETGHQIGTIIADTGYTVINDCGFIDGDTLPVFVFLTDSIQDDFIKINEAVGRITRLVWESSK